MENRNYGVQNSMEKQDFIKKEGFLVLGYLAGAEMWEKVSVHGEEENGVG